MGKFHQLDRTLSVDFNTVTVDGDTTNSWGNTESCFAYLLFSGGNEGQEMESPVYKERRKYKILKEDRSWEPKKTRFKESTDTNYFYMTAFYPWQGSRQYYVIEGVQRDDE